MHKVLAEIIAGVIPHKMTRNQWRGILRFGVFNAIKLNIDIRRNHTTPEHHLAVCAIAKNEGPYFKEWVEWHLSQGVDKFYVYDNESNRRHKADSRTLHQAGYCRVYRLAWLPQAACRIRRLPQTPPLRHPMDSIHRPRRVYSPNQGCLHTRLPQTLRAVSRRRNQLACVWQRRQ